MSTRGRPSPDTTPRLWYIHRLDPSGVGVVLARYRGTEGELLAWLPPGPYAWQWH